MRLLTGKVAQSGAEKSNNGDATEMGKQSQEQVEQERRQDLVFEMTLAGKSAHEIAAELGVDDSEISHVLEQRLEKMGGGGKEGEHHQTLQLARIQKLMAVQWPQATEGDASPQATRTMLRLMEREEALLDQNAARQMQHSGPDGGPVKAQKPAKLDFSAFSQEELKQFLALVAKIKSKDDADSSAAVARKAGRAG